MSTPAAAFVEYRNHYLRVAGIDKQAADGGIDWSGLADQAGQFMTAHPVATGALGGAGLGALSGLFSDRSGSVLRNALIGGGLGAGLGYGYDKLRGYNDNQAILQQMAAEAPRGAEQSGFVNSEKDISKLNPPNPNTFKTQQQGWDKSPTLQFQEDQHPILGNTRFSNPEPKTQLDEKDRQAIAKMELNASKGLGAQEAAKRNAEANSLVEWGKAQGLLYPSFTRSLQYSPEEKAIHQELVKLLGSYSQKAAPSAEEVASAEGLLGSWDATKNVGRNLAALPGEAWDSVAGGLENEAQSSAAQEAAAKMQEAAAKAEMLQKLEAIRKFNNQ